MTERNLKNEKNFEHDFCGRGDFDPAGEHPGRGVVAAASQKNH